VRGCKRSSTRVWRPGTTLLGILRSGDRAAIALITEHVYTAQLRAAVVKLLDRAA
jgi:hypothetical protein